MLIFWKRRIVPFAEGEFSTNSIDEYEFDLHVLCFKRQGIGTQKTQGIDTLSAKSNGLTRWLAMARKYVLIRIFSPLGNPSPPTSNHPGFRRP